jgi:hypothetical protein
MNFPLRRMLGLAAALVGAGCALSTALQAQTAADLPALRKSNSNAARLLLTAPPAPPESLPSEPVARSPISFFRELLAMNASERRQALTNRPPEIRAQILAKVREYESLDPNEREVRLRVTELRWYLRPLMASPATNRAVQLSQIPDRDRKLVEDRLQEWDKVPSDVQKELLGIEPTMQYFAEIEGRSEQQRKEIIKNLSPARREMLEKGIQQWGSMSEEQRRKTLSRFDHFFHLTAPEKDKALQTLSGPERQQIEKTLQTFGSLPPERRAECIRSFAKFTSLSLEERQQFLKNAERWKLMSPGERQAWRELVNRLPPPSLPPLPPELPPLPPSTPRPRPTPTLVTNGN